MAGVVGSDLTCSREPHPVSRCFQCEGYFSSIQNTDLDSIVITSPATPAMTDN